MIVGDRRNWCPKCRQMMHTVQDSQFREHMDNCAGLFRYRCRDCGWMTLSKSKIMDHMARHGPIDLEVISKLKPVKYKDRAL